MGFRTYEEFDGPLGQAPNFVVVRAGDSPPLRAGFLDVVDLESFLRQHGEEHIWVIGGASIFCQSIAFADELYITQLEQVFDCTKFFPEYSFDFHLTDTQTPMTECGIRFQFQIWRRDRVSGLNTPATEQPAV